MNFSVSIHKLEKDTKEFLMSFNCWTEYKKSQIIVMSLRCDDEKFLTHFLNRVIMKKLIFCLVLLKKRKHYVKHKTLWCVFNRKYYDKHETDVVELSAFCKYFQDLLRWGVTRVITRTILGSKFKSYKKLQP